MIRDSSSGRIRAGLRAVLPAVVTLALILVWQQGVSPVARIETDSWLEAMSVISVDSIGYVVAILVALWVASRLDRRQYRAFGLDVTRRWLGNFIVGVVIGLGAFLLSTWYAQFRGVIEISSLLSEVSVGSLEVMIVTGVIAFGVSFLIQNIFEEIVYRGIMLQNFAEGLVERGFSPLWSILVAALGSSVLFGVFHIPLRGIAPSIDAAFVGLTFALAYVLTGNLGLAIGVHFGRFPIELLVVGAADPLGLSAVIEFTAAAPDVELVRMGLTTIAILTWVYFVYGEISIDKTVYQ
ncbi:CPBP family intramembrane glutamic endopeptidase [Natronococcus occultus]|uniref:CAAX amino terminal protease family n=1 Tax=Natronococcus occultus SP4 TaxID=694430 RepID=L0JYB2_9EURY|nr:CPBP family intramembrane glutamic endopeptidase [Natronococcus occultus]AGB38042.1 CAAX amino terminal protease family [Natronococcus occultus SP4]